MIIEANGIRVNCELSGKKQAPVVVLSHSLACSMVMWDPQLDLLEPHFKVLRYDTRGHGGSDAPPGPYTLEQLTDDAVAVLDELSLAKVHWVGLSMGGMIGQGLALKHPERIDRLVLADTSAIIPDEAQPIWQERIDEVQQKSMQAVVDATLERWFTPGYLKKGSPAIEQIRRQVLATPEEGYLGCSEAIRYINYLNRLSQIKAPTLIMVGADDPGTPVEASEAMHARIKGSKLVVIPDAAHLSNIEQAQFFNDNLIGFLQPK